VIILIDAAQSAEEHLYTQNFLLPRLDMDDSDKRKLSFKVADNYTLTISQFGAEAELAAFDGTNKPDDTEHWRGSVCRGFDRLEQGRCIAYSQRASRVDFLTAVEAHSGKDAEVSVRSVNVTDSVLRVELSGGTIIEEELA
jgi:hypothetical protein